MRALLDRTFTNGVGTQMRISAAALDLGGHYADETRAFTNSFPASRNIMAIKGNSHRMDFVWPKRKSTSKSKAIFYSIDPHLARDGIFRLMQYAGEKAPMVPTEVGMEFIDRLMCQERYRNKKDGRWHWRDKKGARAEEEWMCLAYAYAALKSLQLNYKKKWGDLNEAAKHLGVQELNFDPETGELDYTGPDRSAMAIERIERGEPEPVIPPRQRQAAAPPASRKEQKVNEPAPSPPAKKKIKRFRTGLIG